MAGPAKPVSSTGEESGAATDPMRIDTGLIRELAELLTQESLTEIEVSDGDRTITIRRDHAPAAHLVPGSVSATAGPAPQPMTAPPMHGEAPIGDRDGESVRSPMVGTVFLASDPDSGPFVSPGDTVKAGDTLLIVEAMKVMNPITAPRDGTVKEILVENGQPIEFDQPLVLLA